MQYGVMPNLGLYSKPDGPCDNWNELPRAGVVLLAHLLDGFEHAVLLQGDAPAAVRLRQSPRPNRVRFHAIEDVEEIVGVAAHQRTG